MGSKLDEEVERIQSIALTAPLALYSERGEILTDRMVVARSEMTDIKASQSGLCFTWRGHRVWLRWAGIAHVVTREPEAGGSVRG